VSTGGGDCPAAAADPGVFKLVPAATGESGTACAAVPFTVTTVDPAQGKIQFVRPSFVAPITLGAPGSATDTCRIDFFFSVVKAPAHDASAATAGVQTDQLVAVTGVHKDGTSASAAASTTVTVAKATTMLTAKATASAASGGSISDTATLATAPAPAAAPTGTIDFKLYGPTDTACAAAPLFTAQKTVTAAGPYASGPFTPPAAGAYRFQASYTGDASHAASMTACGNPAEIATVGKTTTTITLTASLPGPVGSAITATATLTGTTAPVTGQVTFQVFGPDDATCAATPVFTDTEPVNATGASTSSGYRPAAPGTYAFVATFAGDAGNSMVATTCNAANSTVVVAAAPAATTTTGATTTTTSVKPATPAAAPSSGNGPSDILTAVAIGALAVALGLLLVSLVRRSHAASARAAADSERQEEIVRRAVEDMNR
jgi:hypothetical protein